MRIAVGQFAPAPSAQVNAAVIAEMAAGAAGYGARLLLCPEGSVTDFLTTKGRLVDKAEPLDGPFVEALLEAGRQHQIAIAAGTFVPTGDGRVANTLVVADGGDLRLAYRKLHLYDAFAFTESETVDAGDELPPVLDFDGVQVGFATCYDLRFPELFRALVDRGAQVLALPSAWVIGPGKEEHWLTLLRARAIENTSYVIGADQVGRKAIGRSAAFDPFGLPLLDLGDADRTVGLVDIDLARLEQVREQNPAGTARRLRIELAEQ